MIVDLFAGIGGWAHGAALLGLPDAIGVERDVHACAARRAAGLLTVRADVSMMRVPHRATGITASPPCTAYSTAGKQGASTYLDEIVTAVLLRSWSERPCTDPNVWLVLEVGRWVDEARPHWLACEQVPGVLPVWRAYAETLDALGYATWAGIVDAVDYGVPQERRRAVLLASLDVEPTAPVRARYGPRTAGEALGLGPEWEINTGRAWKKGGTRMDAQRRRVTEPAPTVSSRRQQWWLIRRGAWPTTRVVSEQELAVLQGFDRDVPLAGGARDRYRQIGNAVPPPLAAAALRSVVPA